MVITELTGGLGNQLFQYAAGRNLALELGTDLKCDTGFYETQQLRNFDLRFFNLDFELATNEEVKNLKPHTFLGKVIQRWFPAHRRRVYREPAFHFDKNFFAANDDVYLRGNWQSEQYFSKYSDIIRQDFKIKRTYINALAGFAETLQHCDSVSVHIRRGDYLKPEVSRYHGVLSKEFYLNAIDQIAPKLANPELFIFSDDIDWVKANLACSLPITFVSKEITKTAIEDFYLMQSCRHNIIANSSFSWWAAWLNPHPSKIVVAPDKWFNEGPKDTQDLVPSSWIKM